MPTSPFMLRDYSIDFAVVPLRLAVPEVLAQMKTGPAKCRANLRDRSRDLTHYLLSTVQTSSFPCGQLCGTFKHITYSSGMHYKQPPCYVNYAGLSSISLTLAVCTINNLHVKLIRWTGGSNMRKNRWWVAYLYKVMVYLTGIWCRLPSAEKTGLLIALEKWSLHKGSAYHVNWFCLPKN